MKSNLDLIVVGEGILRVTTALELTRRGHQVTLLDSALPPNPLAASTDISKVMRIMYEHSEVLS
jgi:glycine/D-amino acid oxidase-like deaminating enzyme